MSISKDTTRDTPRSTPQSKPRKPETTIMEDFIKLKELIDKHHRLKRGSYE